jgi:hypothetical protein
VVVCRRRFSAVVGDGLAPELLMEEKFRPRKAGRKTRLGDPDSRQPALLHIPEVVIRDDVVLTLVNRDGEGLFYQPVRFVFGRVEQRAIVRPQAVEVARLHSGGILPLLSLVLLPVLQLLAVDEGVAQEAAVTPGPAVGPAGDPGLLDLVNKNVAAFDLIRMSVMLLCPCCLDQRQI